MKRLGWLGLAAGLGLGAWLGWRGSALPEPVFAPDYSAVVLDRDGQVVRAFLNQRQQWCFAPDPRQEAPEKLVRAVITFEDRRFFSHFGVDPMALARAIGQNLRAGRVVSGASTLTMQVARLAGNRRRTLANKVLEMVQALHLEWAYNKEEILRLYLDHAPYGGNIVGYRTASRRYFGKWPAELTWGEAATLAVLPNAPGLVSPLADRQRLQAKRDRLLSRLLRVGAIDSATCALARLEAVPKGVRPFRWAAPHLARKLKRQLGGQVIRTAIDGGLQRQVERLVQRRAEFLDRLGMGNGAALVVETKTGLVRAYVGSQDFFDRAKQGQVDGVVAPRSSGSVLKPLLYAASMDEGLVLPPTLLRDVPTHYGPFAPNNADESFSGLVRADQALLSSLNVPAVRLLNAYGLYSFYRLLQTAGVSTLFRRAEEYGLPLIIGGAEVTLWDMVGLFRGLGRGGVFAPLRLLPASAVGTERQLLSPGATYLTLEALRQLARPGAEYYWQQYQNQWPLAWKTGTSYGQRDAWAVGTSPQWTIGVWVGNFDGVGSTDLSGARCAGPILFDIFNALPKDDTLAWFAKPEAHLSEVVLCRDTGYAAGPHCPLTEESERPWSARSVGVCPYHQTLFVEGGQAAEQVCSLCWQAGAQRAAAYLVYPADVSQLLRQRGMALQPVPRHRPTCPAQQQSPPLEILYPGANAHLSLPRDFGGQRQRIALKVAHRQRNRQLFWYLDDRFLGTTRERHVWAAELGGGWHVLEVVDEGGYRDRRRFYVDRL